MLREDGHSVTTCSSIADWRDAERQTLPELIIAPIASADPVFAAPGRPMRGFPAPLLFVQNEADLFHDAMMDERLVDRIASPFGAEELLGRVDALIRIRRVVLSGHPLEPIAEEEDGAVACRGLRGWLGIRGRIAAILASRVPRYSKPLAPYREVAARAAAWSDRRDGFQPGHAERVTSFCAMIADGLGLPDDETAALLRAAMLHDLGKVALPVEILRRPGPLEGDQMRLIRTHPEKGAALLRSLDPDEEVAQAILWHHERSDGNGYYGKKAGELPRAARILAVAEIFDAMITSVVREPVPQGDALAVLRAERGVCFDPDCVDALVDAMRPRSPRIPLRES